MAKLSDRIVGDPKSVTANRNYLINAAFEINQRGFAGGQPAAGVYGFDRWKGDATGTRIEQVVENRRTYNEAFTLSWVGGTGAADVNGVTGLNSGDSFTLAISGNFSVIVPTGATDIKLEQGLNATAFTTAGNGIGEELAMCQRYYQIRDDGTTSDSDLRPSMRATPLISGVGPFNYNAEL